MSAYNTVVLPRQTNCPHCGSGIRPRIQFKYGDTQQHDYSVGDRIKWGGNDIGKPARLVTALGYPEDCPVCGKELGGGVRCHRAGWRHHGCRPRADATLHRRGQRQLPRARAVGHYVVGWASPHQKAEARHPDRSVPVRTEPASPAQGTVLYIWVGFVIGAADDPA
jgi:hypothetical protein